MSTGTAIAWGVGVLAGVVGLAFVANASSKDDKAAPKMKGGVVVSDWRRATTIQPGDRVRVSITQTDLDTIARVLGLPKADAAGWERYLKSPEVSAAIQAQGGQIVAWSPGDKLPADWPPDDGNAPREYHAEFVYGGTAAETVPPPIVAWTLPGLHTPIPTTASAKLFDSWFDHDHASIIISRGVAITTIPAKNGGAAAALYFWPQWLQNGVPIAPPGAVAVVVDYDMHRALQTAMAQLAALGGGGGQIGDPNARIEIGASHGSVAKSLGTDILTLPVGVAGSTTQIGYLAFYYVWADARKTSAYLQGLFALSEPQAQSLAAAAIAAWNQQHAI